MDILKFIKNELMDENIVETTILKNTIIGEDIDVLNTFVNTLKNKFNIENLDINFQNSVENIINIIQPKKNINKEEKTEEKSATNNFSIIDSGDIVESKRYGRGFKVIRVNSDKSEDLYCGIKLTYPFIENITDTHLDQPILDKNNKQLYMGALVDFHGNLYVIVHIIDENCIRIQNYADLRNINYGTNTVRKRNIRTVKSSELSLETYLYYYDDIVKNIYSNQQLRVSYLSTTPKDCFVDIMGNLYKNIEYMLVGGKIKGLQDSNNNYFYVGASVQDKKSKVTFKLRVFLNDFFNNVIGATVEDSTGNHFNFGLTELIVI